jgi:hypothetical protein
MIFDQVGGEISDVRMLPGASTAGQHGNCAVNVQ